MPSHDLHLIGIGNAAMDIVCAVSDAQLELLDLGVPKASCAFPDIDKVREIEARLKEWNLTCEYWPGGSAANTACAIVALGGRAGFIGKVANDEFGSIFTAALHEDGTAFQVLPINETQACTTRVFTFITPDCERTFAAYHGSSDFLTPDDMAEEAIARAFYLYIDGYMLASAHGYASILRAIEHARRHGHLVVFNLSALSVLENWPAQVRELTAMADGVLCNRAEALALTGRSDIPAALEVLAPPAKFACVTSGAEGAWARREGVTVHHDGLFLRNIYADQISAAGAEKS